MQRSRMVMSGACRLTTKFAQPRQLLPTDAATPVHEQTLMGSVGYRKSWANFDAGATVTATHTTYDDVRSTSGTILDQTFRNENDLALQAFLNYRLSQRIQSNLTFWAGKSEIP